MTVQTPVLKKLILSGYAAAFLGAIPVSPVNLTVLQISVDSGSVQAGWFALGMVLVEAVFIRFSLGGLRQLLERAVVRQLLERIVLLLLFALALFSFYAAYDEGISGSAITTGSGPGNLLVGMGFRLFNPTFMLFWMGLNTAFLTRGILPPSSRHFAWHTLSGSAGTASALLVYCLGGEYLEEHLAPYRRWMHILIGLCFLATAIWLAFGKRK